MQLVKLRPLLRRRFVLRHLHDGADHFVDGRHDFQHLLPRDEPVTVLQNNVETVNFRKKKFHHPGLIF